MRRGCKLGMTKVVAHVYEKGSLKRRYRGKVSFLFSSLLFSWKIFSFFFLSLSGVWRTIRLHSTSDPDPCTLI